MRSSTTALGAISVLAVTTLSTQGADVDARFSTAQIAAGASLYENNCARCHGVGMVDAEAGFFDLRSFPPEQRSRFMNSVANGKNSMPPWRSVLTQEEIGNLFAYVVAGGNNP